MKKGHTKRENYRIVKVTHTNGVYYRADVDTSAVYGLKKEPDWDAIHKCDSIEEAEKWIQGWIDNANREIDTTEEVVG